MTEPMASRSAAAWSRRHGGRSSGADPGITPSANALHPSEDGDSGGYRVNPASLPEETVTVPVSSSDTSAAGISPSQLQFTTDNWDERQLAGVLPVDDHIDHPGDARVAVITNTASGGGDSATTTGQPARGGGSCPATGPPPARGGAIRLADFLSLGPWRAVARPAVRCAPRPRETCQQVPAGLSARLSASAGRCRRAGFPASAAHGGRVNPGEVIPCEPSGSE